MLKGCKYSILGSSVLVVDDFFPQSENIKDYANIAINLANIGFGVGANIVAFIGEIEFNQLTTEKCVFPKYVSDNLISLFQKNSITKAIIVRSFLPSGHELIFSSTSLCASACYVYHRDNNRDVKIINGVFSPFPTIHNVYKIIESSVFNLSIAEPTRLPSYCVNELFKDIATPLSEKSAVESLISSINFGENSYTINFYATFVGEPYLVCFVGNGLSNNSQLPEQEDLLLDIFEQPLYVQDNILNQIARSFNESYNFLRPQDDIVTGFDFSDGIINSNIGINFVFVDISSDNTLVCRFFRRGICDEVPISGSGALAASVVAYNLGLVHQFPILIRGLLNTQIGIFDTISISKTGEIWWIEMPVDLIFSAIIKD